MELFIPLWNQIFIHSFKIINHSTLNDFSIGATMDPGVGVCNWPGLPLPYADVLLIFSCFYTTMYVQQFWKYVLDFVNILLGFHVT